MSESKHPQFVESTTVRFVKKNQSQPVIIVFNYAPPETAILTQIDPIHIFTFGLINLLTPNDPYMGRTPPLTSKRCILYIYSTNIGTEYFKHALYSPFFSLQNAVFFHNSNLFGSCIIHILYTECAKIKKKIFPAPKG